MNQQHENNNTSWQTATLGGGCFWCLEAVYDDLRGIERVESGYAGGSIPNPTYEQVCTGRTGHAEVIQLDFDPDIISYQDILQIFFTIHDPTTLNRQGLDVGNQYRSAIFYHNEEQESLAIDSKNKLQDSGKHSRDIVTEITPASTFYVAEELWLSPKSRPKIGKVKMDH